jgi:hypothetical protein
VAVAEEVVVAASVVSAAAASAAAAPAAAGSPFKSEVRSRFEICFYNSKCAVILSRPKGGEGSQLQPPATTITTITKSGCRLHHHPNQMCDTQPDQKNPT